MQNKPLGKHLFLYLDIVDPYTSDVIGQIGDISKEGLMMITNQSLPLYQTREICIKLPDDSEEFSKEVIRAQIETRWIKPDEVNPKLYCIGCLFSRLDPDDMDLFARVSAKKSSNNETRAARKNLLFYLEIIDNKTHQLLGHLGDISKDGIMIIAEQPMASGQIKDVMIKLPNFEEFPKKAIHALIETRWTKPDINPNFHCIGCRFYEMDYKDIPLIEQVQEILGFNE